ncbi:RNA-directed DNA polymerase [Tanacetum coccineum]
MIPKIERLSRVYELQGFPYGLKHGLEYGRYGISRDLDTTYRGFLGVGATEVQAQIRRIFLDGYGVLLRLERVEALRKNHHELENEDSEDEEFNPLHVNRKSESSDEEAQYQHNDRRNNHSQRGANMRVDILVFEGRIQPDEFIDWILTVERVFDNQEIRDDLKPFISYSDVYKLATKVEKQLMEKEGRNSITYGVSRGYASNKANSSQSIKLVATKASHAPQTHDGGAGPSRTRQKSVQCFKCKGHGHISTDCPNQRVFTLFEEPIEEESQEFDSPPVFDEPLEQKDVIYGDTEELPVIQRTLAVDSIEDSAWLRHNIFHARCASHGKFPWPCHLLLGRPWQFNRWTIHDGLKNTYSFDKDGGKIVLGPSKYNVTPRKSEVEGNYFVSKSKFSEAFEKSKVAYALLIKDLRDNDQRPP